jgi:hypothetical protein
MIYQKCAILITVEKFPCVQGINSKLLIKIKTKHMGKRLIAHSIHLTFGLFLIVLGVFLYARQMGLIPADFPVWPVVLVAFGAIMIAGELSK